MTEPRSYKMRQRVWPNRSDSILLDVQREVPLLAAIAQELRQPGDDELEPLPAAWRLLQDTFQSLDRANKSELLESA